MGGPLLAMSHTVPEKGGVKYVVFIVCILSAYGANSDRSLFIRDSQAELRDACLSLRFVHK